MKKILAYLTLGVIVGPFPFTIANGQTEDANPVMADFLWLQSQVNANALPLSGGAVTPGTGGTGSTTGVGLSYFVPAGGVGGSANAITLTTNVVPPLGFFYGMFVIFVPNAANTGPTTVSVNGGPALPVLVDSSALTGGEIPAGSGGVRLYMSIANNAWGMERINNGDVWLMPQNIQNNAYTTVLYDRGKHIYHAPADTTARTWAIDSNANVPYEIGTALTFINDVGAGVITLGINADTLVLAPTGATGNRTLTAPAVATAIKVNTTRWLISGTNIT